MQAKFLERTKGDFNAKFVKPKRGKGQGKEDESSSSDISMLSCSDDSMGDSFQPLEPELASLWLGDEPMLGDDALLPDLEPALTSLLIDEASPCLCSMPSMDTIDTGHIYLNHSSVNWPTLSASKEFSVHLGCGMYPGCQQRRGLSLQYHHINCFDRSFGYLRFSATFG